MATVRIVRRPTGLYNGRVWPEVGEKTELPDVVAKAMAGSGTVEIVTGEAPKIEKRTRKAAESRKG